MLTKNELQSAAVAVASYALELGKRKSYALEMEYWRLLAKIERMAGEEEQAKASDDLAEFARQQCLKQPAEGMPF